jgi:hypothetical protein
MPAGTADLIVSSPPYCIGKAYETSVNTSDFVAMHERLDSYEIPGFNISERERRLFDKACTGKGSRRKMPSSLTKLGFSEEDVEAYSHLIRFLPHYTETLI